jgi:NarL family two-component system response regulator YdfI
MRWTREFLKSPTGTGHSGESSKLSTMTNEASRGEVALKGRALLQITPGERHALRLIAQGKAFREVGQCLGVPQSEVGPHLTALFAKLGAGSQAEAIAEAARRGIVDA